MRGSIPLSTLRAKVEYGFAEAQTAAGEHRHQGVDQQRRLSDRGDRPMPLMPKRVKFRKSQRGKVQGNAHAAATTSPTATSACSARRRLAQRRGDRGGPHHGDAVRPRRRPALHPRLPAQVGDGASRPRRAWARARASRSTGPPWSSRADPVRDRRPARGRGPRLPGPRGVQDAVQVPVRDAGGRASKSTGAWR